MSTYRVTFIIELEHENDDEIGIVQDAMDDGGADAIFDGLKRGTFGTLLRDVRNVSVSEADE